MKAIEHTAGPWRLNAGDESRIMANNRAIAHVEIGGMSGIKWPEAEANARLIIAAPDMLAGLIKIAAYGDVMANRVLAESGSYALFDEPDAVQGARELLERLGLVLPTPPEGGL